MPGQAVARLSPGYWVGPGCWVGLGPGQWLGPGQARVGARAIGRASARAGSG